MNAALRPLLGIINPVMLAVLMLAAAKAFPEPREACIFLLRSALALLLTFVLAHVNRWGHLWRGHELFPSGHEAFLASVSTSLVLLNPRWLIAVLPLMLVYGGLMVHFQFHAWLDVFGAILLGPPITWACHSSGPQSK